MSEMVFPPGPHPPFFLFEQYWALWFSSQDGARQLPLFAGCQVLHCQKQQRRENMGVYTGLVTSALPIDEQCPEGVLLFLRYVCRGEWDVSGIGREYDDQLNTLSAQNLSEPLAGLPPHLLFSPPSSPLTAG